MATTVARLEAILSADTGQFDKSMTASQKRMHNVGKVAGLAGAAIVGGLAVGLKSSVGAAKDAQVAQITLNQALDASGISQAKYGKAIEANIQKTSKLAALDDEDLSNAFAKLVRTTGSVTKATEGMNLAADIARSRHVSLESATKAVEKAYNGSDAALKRFGVSIPKVTDAADTLKRQMNDLKDKMKGATGATKEKMQADYDSLKASMEAARASDKQASAAGAIAKAQERYSGAAAEYGKSGAAANERFQVAVENLQESLGTMLLPAITKVANAAASMATFFEEHKNVTKILIGVVAGLGAVLLTTTAAMKIYNAWTVIQTGATKAWAAAQWLINAALTANPIGLVIVAIAALGGALILAYQRSETFRNIVQGALNGVKSAAQAVATFFTETVQPLFAKALTLIQNHPAWIATKFAINNIGTALDAVKAGIQWIGNNAGDAIAAASASIKKPVGLITDAFEALAKVIDKIKDALIWLRDNIEDILGPVVSVVKKVGGALGHIPGLGGTGPFAAGDVIPPGPVGGSGGGGGGGGGGGSFPGLTSSLQDEAALARGSFAYEIQSYNPASTLPSGRPSDHAVYPAKAFDAMFSPATGWNNAGARAFFSQMIGRAGIHYAILGDKIWSAEQGLHPYLNGGHDNHVHVSSFDKGGWLPPRSATLAVNGTNKWEPVGPPGRGMGDGVTVNVYGDVTGHDLVAKVRDALIQINRRTGGNALGGLT